MGLDLWLISCTQHIIGVSLSEPHNDHDNGPCAENNCIWVSMYYLQCVLSHTCFQDPWSRNALCILVCCCGSCARCQDSKNLSLIHVVCCKDCQDWHEGKCADTWYKLSLLRHVLTQQLAIMQWPVCWRTIVFNICTTLRAYYCACVLYNEKASLALPAYNICKNLLTCHNINQLRNAPSISWMH